MLARFQTSRVVIGLYQIWLQMGKGYPRFLSMYMDFQRNDGNMEL
jgi:hypothetical protein